MKFSKSAKKILILTVTAALCAGFAYFHGGGKSRTSAVSYRTAPVVRGALRSIIQSTGTLRAEETVDVGTQISGTIDKIYFDYNDRVTQGQLIAQMDDRTQQAEVDVAQANLLSAQADLAKAKASLLKATRDLKRTRALIKEDLIARSELDADIETEATAKADVKAAEAKVAQCEATLRKTQITLGYTKIYSPVDGVVVTKSVEAGQTVAASYQTPSIAEIARDLKQMQVEVNVDEADIGSVREGQTAEFTVDAYTGRTFKGKVTQVRISSTTTDSVVSYTVIVKVSNDDEKLMPGMTANVSIIIADKENALLVPNSALRFRPVTEGSNDAGGPPSRKPTVGAVESPGVYVLQKGRPVKIEVEKGITDGNRTEILSGLQEKTAVLTGYNLQSERK